MNAITSIYSLTPNPTNQEIYISIMMTFFKLNAGIAVEDLMAEDKRNIKNFYNYITLLGALGMLKEEAKQLAYEEMRKYVGNYQYPKELITIYTEKYLELLEYEQLEEATETLKLA